MAGHDAVLVPGRRELSRKERSLREEQTSASLSLKSWRDSRLVRYSAGESACLGGELGFARCCSRLLSPEGHGMRPVTVSCSLLERGPEELRWEALCWWPPKSSGIPDIVIDESFER